MKTKYLIIIGIFLGINAMFGLRWFTASSETRTLQQTIEQAYDVGDYETITESNFTQYESLESNTQEQILLALIKSNDLLQAQDLLARTTNPSDNTRLYSKLITFTLQEDRDAVQRVAESQNSSIATIKALLFYFRALVLYNTGQPKNTQVLLEQSLSLDGLAGATHLLGAKIAPKLEYRPWSKIDAFYDTAEQLGVKFTDVERYDRGIVKFYIRDRDTMKKYFFNINDSEYNNLLRKIFEGRAILEEGDLDESKKLFLEANSIDGDSRIPYLWIGRNEAEQENRAEAKIWYEQGLEKSRNWEILTDLVRVYDALGETDKIQLISFQIEQILGSNVGIHTGVLRRFIEIYEPNYLKKYADDALKKYNNGTFDREEADERYENSLQSLYTTIQESYITLMVHSRTTGKLGDSYRDILVSMQEPNEITLIYMLLAYEHVGDSVAIERLRPLLASTDRRILGLIRTFNRLYLGEYTQAVRELADTADELTDLDILWLSWRVRKDQGLPNSNQVSQLTQLLEATNEETITLEAGFEAHFATVTGKIRKFYPPVENDTQKE